MSKRHLFFSCHFDSLRNSQRRGIRDLFVHRVKRDRASAAVLEEIERYVEALAVEREWLPLMLILTWAERALDWVERAGIGDPLGGQLRANRYAGYLEVLAARRAAWFAEHRWP